MSHRDHPLQQAQFPALQKMWLDPQKMLQAVTFGRLFMADCRASIRQLRLQDNTWKSGALLRQRVRVICSKGIQSQKKGSTVFDMNTDGVKQKHLDLKFPWEVGGHLL